MRHALQAMETNDASAYIPASHASFFDRAEMTDTTRTPPPRIERVEIDGQAGFLKRPEILIRRMRLQKGDAIAAFEAERSAYQRLGELGLPVPKLLDEGEDYFVTKDSGPSMIDLLRRGGASHEDFKNAIGMAAETLADFHARGYSHGRPALKDICWDQKNITFIDLERISPSRDNLKGHGLDVLVFFFSLISETGSIGDEAFDARKRYQAKDTKGIWQEALRQTRKLRVLAFVLWPLIRLLKNKREFAAIGPFLRFFSGDQFSD